MSSIMTDTDDNTEIFESTVITTTKIVKQTNMCRFATEDELKLNQDAYNVLFGLIFPLNPNDLSIHFKRVNVENQLMIIKKDIILVQDLHNEYFKQLSIAFKTRDRLFKKKFNTIITRFLGHVKETSPFIHLLLIDEQLKYVSKRIPRQRDVRDFNSPWNESVSNGKFILHPNGCTAESGRIRTTFETPEECLSAMRGCIEQCTNWKTHVIEYIDPPSPYAPKSIPSTMDYKKHGRIKLISSSNAYYSLAIPFVGSPQYWVNSDDTRLKHILCGGKPPNTSISTKKRNRSKRLYMNSTDSTDSKDLDDLKQFNALYPVYIEFLALVENKIMQLIRESHNNKQCPYTIIPCCRIDPSCDGQTVCLKPSFEDSKFVVCGVCTMELCANGCGKIYHGNNPCEISFDEASNIFIQNTSKLCPMCTSPIYKVDGCNHMTCRCGCNFCWICGDELPRDEHGHYSTALHYGITGEGIGGGCRQYN